MIYKRIIKTSNDILDNNILEYNFTVNTKNKNNNISIYKEILRENIINNLIKLCEKKLFKLNTIVKKNILIKLYKYNKLNDIIQKWCWIQYSNIFCQDYVIPYVSNNSYNWNNIIDNINYILNINIDINNNIIKNLLINIHKFLKKNYIKYKKLLKNNIKLSISKTISNDSIILTTLYNEKLYKLNINKELYKRLYDKFKNNNNITNHDKYIFCLIFRYSYIDSGNQQLAINYDIKNMFKKYVDFELYGSAINAVSNHYCSLFYDIEQYFGSKGNFFDIIIEQGIFWCNPPYDNDIMENTAIKLINIINNYVNVAFIITIPIWDLYSKNIKLNNIIRNYNKNNGNFDDYKIYSLLKQYIQDEIMIPKKKIHYFNYRLNTKIYASDTYMLIVYKNINKIYVNHLHDIFSNIINFYN